MRTANRRGQGGQLREEILQAASRLVGGVSSGDAITLRAIAREAGIAAPSIYPHFADRDAILDTLIERTFAGLADAARLAYEGAPTGRARVHAVAGAYIGFAEQRPGDYRIIFERGPSMPADPKQYPAGLRAFSYLVDAVAGAGSTDPDRDAQALWAAAHGLITLPPALPAFGWLPRDALVARLIDALVGT